LLADLARQSGSVKGTIVKAGGINHLVGLLQGSSSIAQKHASCALWGLTSEPSYQAAVAKAGAVRPLVQLLSSSSEAQGYAAAALCNLAHDEGARQAIAEGGGIELCTALSHGPQNWLRSQAVGILQLLRVEVPQAQALPIKIVPQLPYYKTHENSSPRRRAWDSTHRNPRFLPEKDGSCPFEHLLSSPRKNKPTRRFTIHDPKVLARSHGGPGVPMIDSPTADPLRASGGRAPTRELLVRERLKRDGRGSGAAIRQTRAVNGSSAGGGEGSADLPSVPDGASGPPAEGDVAGTLPLPPPPPPPDTPPKDRKSRRSSKETVTVTGGDSTGGPLPSPATDNAATKGAATQGEGGGGGGGGGAALMGGDVAKKSAKGAPPAPPAKLIAA